MLYKLTGYGLIVLGVAFGVASAVLAWGLAALLAVGGCVGGWMIVTDRRPPRST